MGYNDHRHEHQAVDGLVNLLTRANHDLNDVQLKLEREFRQAYPDHANPMELMSRMKKVQEEIVTLKEQCREILAAKQDLIDKARTILVGNRNTLQRMHVSMGLPSDGLDGNDHALADFNQIIDEWTAQVRSTTTGDEQHKSDSDDVNRLLFSAIVGDN